MSWGKGRGGRIAAGRGVVDEAERLLCGRTLESYIARRERVPVWALISLLAHASRSDLVRLSHPAGHLDPKVWSGTVARLAGGLVEIGRDEDGLVALQRQSLVPLELDLLGGMAEAPRSPRQLFEMVSGAVGHRLSAEF